tara:strand:- start:402 stop:623 length:222 start_codon:yes stop_codon:yes gene_type:complete
VVKQTKAIIHQVIPLETIPTLQPEIHIVLQVEVLTTHLGVALMAPLQLVDHQEGLQLVGLLAENNSLVKQYEK